MLRKRAIEPVVIARPHRDAQSDRDPQGQQRRAPAAGRPQPGKRRQQAQPAVKSPQPPIGRTGDPEMAAGDVSGGSHAPLQAAGSSGCRIRRTDAPTAARSNRPARGRPRRSARTAIGSHTSVFSTTAMGVQRWNRAITNGMVSSQIVTADERQVPHAASDGPEDPRRPAKVLGNQSLQRVLFATWWPSSAGRTTSARPPRGTRVAPPCGKGGSD